MICDLSFKKKKKRKGFFNFQIKKSVSRKKVLFSMYIFVQCEERRRIFCTANYFILEFKKWQTHNFQPRTHTVLIIHSLSFLPSEPSITSNFSFHLISSNFSLRDKQKIEIITRTLSLFIRIKILLNSTSILDRTRPVSNNLQLFFHPIYSTNFMLPSKRVWFSPSSLLHTSSG